MKSVKETVYNNIAYIVIIFTNTKTYFSILVGLLWCPAAVPDDTEEETPAGVSKQAGRWPAGQEPEGGPRDLLRIQQRALCEAARVLQDCKGEGSQAHLRPRGGPVKTPGSLREGACEEKFPLVHAEL